MSDFDKEAERERLREKYEREEQKREATEKMSELLLKGATMTNAHCQDCGDPIFRYDGQEFCATCERAVQRDTGDGADADDAAEAAGADSAATNDDQEEIEVATPDETRVRFGGDTAEDGDATADEDAPASEARKATTSDVPDASVPEATDAAVPPQQPAPESGDHRVPSADTAGGGDLAGARDSLSRTVTGLAEQAEATTDLDRKRALLAATREAADALAAVREAGR